MKCPASELELNQLLSDPSQSLLNDISKIEGDFLILGAAGKMGPSLCHLLKNAVTGSRQGGKIYAVSRFSNSSQKVFLDNLGIQTFSGDLLDISFLKSLPDARNIIYMAGQKFGTQGNQSLTWAMNVLLPGMVCQRFQNSRIVAFSTGNVYPLVDVTSGGATENTTVDPVGEYAQSCLGRERIFEYFSQNSNISALLFRLNYALDLRYGVLNDLALKVWNDQPIDLSMGYVNVIWQGDANEFAIRSLLFCHQPARPLNVTGPDILSVRELALKIASFWNKTPIFKSVENSTALLNNASLAFQYFGNPKVTINQMCEWTASWVRGGGTTLHKPTHFETRDGRF